MVGALKEARHDYPGALDSYRQSVKIYEEFVRRQPDNSRGRHTLAAAYYSVGRALAAQGNHLASLESLRKSLDIEEPSAALDRDDKKVHDNLGWLLKMTSSTAVTAGRLPEARRYASRLVAASKAWAERPNSSGGDWSDYALDLLTCDPPDLRNPSLALSAAKRAVQISGNRDPAVLDTLALALFTTGDRKQAVTTERQAITLVGDNASARNELEANLRRCEKSGSDK